MPSGRKGLSEHKGSGGRKGGAYTKHKGSIGVTTEQQQKGKSKAKKIPNHLSNSASCLKEVCQCLVGRKGLSEDKGSTTSNHNHNYNHRQK